VVALPRPPQPKRERYSRPPATARWPRREESIDTASAGRGRSSGGGGQGADLGTLEAINSNEEATAGMGADGSSK
jgi:hypothetical protein